MDIKEMPIYLCSPDGFNLLKITDVSTIAGHKAGHHEDRQMIAPIKIEPESINPETLLILKEKFDIKELLLIDRIKGTDGVVTIADHVNISGQNFLRAKTPHGDLPQFPDMSKIYNKIEGYREAIVYTIGSDRFINQQGSNTLVLSEWLGLIASVAHYIGIRIFAFGISKPEEILDII